MTKIDTRNNKNNINPGMFNFQQVMNEFYGYKPKDDDAYGNAMKNSFQANMIQSAWDSNMSKGLAENQAALSMGAMSHAADLDLRNQAALMQQQFNLGMSKSGADYTYQNEFADNQNERDIVNLGATHEQGRKTLAATGLQNRLQTIVQGEQERLTDTNRITEAGKETRAADSNRIFAQGYQNRQQTETEGSEIRKTAVTQGDQDRKRIGAEGDQNVRGIAAHSDADVRGVASRSDANVRSIGATSDADVRKVGAQGDQRVREIGALGDERVREIGAQGHDQRFTMSHGNRLEAKTRADQSKYSKGLARSF